MSKTPPLGKPFFVTVRRRHADAGCRAQSDQCVIARALDAAFPEFAGFWRVGMTGVSLLDPEAPDARLGDWGHDAQVHVQRYDHGLPFPPDLRVHFRPQLRGGIGSLDSAGYALSQVMTAAQQKWGKIYLTNGTLGG